MSTRLSINGKDVPLNGIVRLKGKGKFKAARLMYFLLKTLNQMPRLYGITSHDPIETWRRNFESKFGSILTSQVEPGRIKLEGQFSLDMEKFIIRGKATEGGVSVSVELLKKPENVPQGIRGMVEVDSFYFADLKRPKPLFVPGSKDGILAGFHRFLVLQAENASGVPKTLGIVSEFINSIVLPHGYSTTLRGKRLTTDEKEGLFLDGEPLYNVDPKLLSLLSMSLALEMSSEDSILIIEDPEAHLDKEDLRELTELFARFKGTLILATDYEFPSESSIEL
ncbi:hypothetical protein [Metallosphaera cuprina]|nr:hypothetical protein [Metallosphaera cuprina]